jgi:hypothetical protein
MQAVIMQQQKYALSMQHGQVFIEDRFEKKTAHIELHSQKLALFQTSHYFSPLPPKE